MSPCNVRRYITIFERVGDDFIEDVTLSDKEFEAVRTILDYDSAHPMFDCYPIEGSCLVEVYDLLGERLLQGEYDYFLEAELAN